MTVRLFTKNSGSYKLDLKAARIHTHKVQYNAEHYYTLCLI